MEIKNNSKKIILLLFPLIINKFDFLAGGKGMFFDLGKIRKKTLKEKNFLSLAGEEILKLVEVNYNQEVKEFVQHNPNSKLVLVNYPHSEQQFDSLSPELAQMGKKIDNIILLNISNFELILSLKNEYLICPLCERICRKEEAVKENEKFICRLRIFPSFIIYSAGVTDFYEIQINL